MSRWPVLILIALVILVALGLLLPYLLKARLEAHLVTSRNNLRDLAFFAAHNSNPDPNTDAVKLLREIPPGTIVLPGVPPEERLSWVVAVLPGLDQKKHPVEQLLAQIRLDQPWAAEANQQAARTRLPVLLCPENTPQVPPDAPAVTCYVGIAGLGPDAATLTLAPGTPAPPRAGAFRYDSPTPFDKITDGLSQTLLMGETADSPGPWLRGGTSTVRGLDDKPGAKPLIGPGGQFGGYFPTGGNFALCDGSVRTFTPRTTPGVLLKMATIAGGDGGPVVGE
jgi:hypothetical protein